MSTLRRGLKPSLPDDVALLDRPRIVRQVNLLLDAGKDGAAYDLRKHSRSFCEWCVSEGYIAFNPMAGLRLPRLSKSEKLAQEGSALRALTDDEIRALWTATAVPTSFHNLVRLCLATGLRKGEAARLRWSDIDFKAGKIAVPGAHTKTGTPHMVALSSLSRLILSQVPRRMGSLLFPSDRVAGGATSLSGWTQLVKRVSKASGIPDLKTHMLRKTFRTKLSEGGAREDVSELAIGHARKGLVKTYDFSVLWQERIEATETATALIAAAAGVDLSTVVPLRAPARA